MITEFLKVALHDSFTETKRILYLAVLLVVIASSCNGQTVYITKTGEKYHRGTCQYLRYSKYAVKLEDAKERGFTACSVCRPTLETIKSDSLKIDTVIREQQIPVQRNVKATQCTGITKAGARCKRMTTNANGRCYQH